jgi:hypothetical protein
MAGNFTPRSRWWFRWANILPQVVAGCAQLSVTAVAAPQIPAGAARIWFYQYEVCVACRALIPTIVANGTDIGQAPPGTVFHRDVPPGHYDIAVPNRFGFNYGSGAHFDLAVGQQAFVKIVYFGGSYHQPWQQAPGFGALLVPKQVAEAEVPSLAAGSAQQ